MGGSILVPMDGSTLAQRALPYAALVARGSGARIVLAHVVSSRGWDGSPDIERDLAAMLGEIAEPLRREGLTVDLAFYNGYFTEVGRIIANAAADKQVDLVVCSSHGRSGISRLFLGSVADEVIRHAPVPLLLVPAHCEHPAAPTGRAVRLNVALDGSDVAETVLQPAAQLADALQAEITLVRVVEPPNYGLEPGKPARFSFEPEEELARAEEYLTRVAGTIQSSGRSVKTRVIGGFAGPSVASLAQPKNGDLLAISTHGRSGISRSLLGSVATEVIKRASVPLLLVGPAAAQARMGGS